MQLMRMIMISVLTGIVAAGIVWLSGDLADKLRAGKNDNGDEQDGNDKAG